MMLDKMGVASGPLYKARAAEISAGDNPGGASSDSTGEC